MGMLAKTKELVVGLVIQRVVQMAAKGARKDVDGTLRKMITGSMKFTRDPLWQAVLRDVLHKLDTNHPAIGVARRFLLDLNPKVRRQLVDSLIIKGTLTAPRIRHALERKLGFYPPSTIVISPTMNCPLRCYGCYAAEYKKEDSLTFEEVDRVINEAKELGIHFVVLSGGEPFAWPPIMKTFESQSDVFFLVYTSGMQLDDETVDRLADLGNVCPAISCEGFEEETDRRRGKGAFKKVTRSMERLRDKGVAVSFSATATRRNLDIITSDRFVDHLVEAGCIMGWYFSYMPIGRSPDLDLMPTPEQRVELSRRVKDLRARKPIVLIDFWNDGEYSGGCIAGGRKYLHINNRGDAEPCVFCHFAKDNIRDKSLQEILAGDFFRAIRERQPYNPDLRRVCIMIDNPSVLREVVKETGARPTHKGAESLLTDFADALDKYAEDFGKALEKGPVVDIKHRV